MTFISPTLPPAGGPACLDSTKDKERIGKILEMKQALNKGVSAISHTSATIVGVAASAALHTSAPGVAAVAAPIVSRSIKCAADSAEDACHASIDSDRCDRAIHASFDCFGSRAARSPTSSASPASGLSQPASAAAASAVSPISPSANGAPISGSVASTT